MSEALQRTEAPKSLVRSAVEAVVGGIGKYTKKYGMQLLAAAGLAAAAPNAEAVTVGEETEVAGVNTHEKNEYTPDLNEDGDLVFKSDELGMIAGDIMLKKTSGELIDIDTDGDEETGLSNLQFSPDGRGIQGTSPLQGSDIYSVYDTSPDESWDTASSAFEHSGDFTDGTWTYGPREQLLGTNINDGLREIVNESGTTVLAIDGRNIHNPSYDGDGHMYYNNCEPDDKNACEVEMVSIGDDLSITSDSQWIATGIFPAANSQRVVYSKDTGGGNYDLFEKSIDAEAPAELEVDAIGGEEGEVLSTEVPTVLNWEDAPDYKITLSSNPEATLTGATLITALDAEVPLTPEELGANLYSVIMKIGDAESGPCQVIAHYSIGGEEHDLEYLFDIQDESELVVTSDDGETPLFGGDVSTEGDTEVSVIGEGAVSVEGEGSVSFEDIGMGYMASFEDAGFDAGSEGDDMDAVTLPMGSIADPLSRSALNADTQYCQIRDDELCTVITRSTHPILIMAPNGKTVVITPDQLPMAFHGATLNEVLSGDTGNNNGETGKGGGASGNQPAGCNIGGKSDAGAGLLLLLAGMMRRRKKGKK
ncbi:hypothetical protein HOD30_02690 [Candidatus Peregrinibacteria bacterium]|jgi:hypothetical protein|nr:hypothetical protein [Candidatus Peregrinibacteria bacterium]MBT4631574.1 hypothetical protein [Candidatus Peregrinibacteria bacterium]